MYIHLHTQIDMFTSDYAESSLSCTLAGLWMTEKGWIKGTVNLTACWAHSASNIQNQHILQIPLNWFFNVPERSTNIIILMVLIVDSPNTELLALWLSPLQHLKCFYTHHCHWMNGWKVTIDINGFTMVFGLQNHW